MKKKRKKKIKKKKNLERSVKGNKEKQIEDEEMKILIKKKM